jgi:hypothetical protein
MVRQRGDEAVVREAGCLGLNEQFGSSTDLGFYRKSVLPPVYFYFDHCVGLVAVEIDSLRFPADDLRGESGRTLEPLQGCGTMGHEIESGL